MLDGERVIKRRAKREDFAIKQKALAIAAPIGKEIGSWQDRVTRLSMVMTRPQCSPEARQAAERALIEVRDLVADRREQLEELSIELPPKLATSSWLGDIQQGLASLQRRLAAVVTSSGPAVHASRMPPPGWQPERREPSAHG